MGPRGVAWALQGGGGGKNEQMQKPNHDTTGNSETKSRQRGVGGEGRCRGRCHGGGWAGVPLQRGEVEEIQIMECDIHET